MFSLALANLFSQNCASVYHFDANQEAAIGQWIENHRNTMGQRTTVTIPVVVHVVWRLPIQQISEEQVLSQIEVLNQDFRALNADLSVVPSDFQNKIADLEIEFCLAQQDPEGQPSNGITYTQTTILNIGTTLVGGQSAIFYSTFGGKDAWDTEHYLNIWVGERAFACGEAVFPSEATPEKDGIIIRYDCFGTTGTATAPYHLGRTATHEIGHYFNLLHVWGPGIIDLACLVDDLVEDTPLQAFNYLDQCPVHPQVSCGSQDMFMNYMNLSDDPCLNLFTHGQKERVWAALNMYRAELLKSNGCEPPVAAREEHPLSNQIVLSSQPAVDWIRLKLENRALLPLNFQLFKINGQLLFQEKWEGSHTFEMNCENLSPGIYIITVDDRVNRWSQRLIIQY